MAVLTEEQSMLRDAARTWTQEKSPVSAFRKMRDSGAPLGYDPAAFNEMAEMGWTGVIIPEEYGGSDFGYLSLGLVLEELGRTLCRCLCEIGYQNAGTVEFLMDRTHQLYFIEMNTRIQVEHPVTEAITGVDMVKAQLRIASGDRLSDILPPKLEIRGHAIECRINAEHPRKFTPSAGQITAFNVPGGNGVRVDTAQYAEGVIPPYYDSLIAKLIVHGCDRAEAIAKMERALSQFVVQGVETSITLHQEIFQDSGFRAGNFDTGFMERFLAARPEPAK